MTNATDESASARVCPRCGEKAGNQPFCGGCGLNLAQQAELPDAEEYAARLREEQWLRTQRPAATPTSRGGWTENDRAVAQQVADEAADAPLAGWWARAGAIVIDTLILVIPWAILGFLFGPLLGALVNLGLWFGYFMLMVRDAQNGQSLGMQALGIRVRREDGKPVDAQTVAMRQLLMQGIVFGLLAVLIVPYLLNYLWPLWDRENRALHDMAAKTRVVRA
jgi:uncharacterized RDD family membrane protein YckC